MESIDENERKRRRRPYAKIIIKLALVVVIVSAIIILGYMVFTMYKRSFGSYRSYEVVSSLERSDGSSASYISYSNELLMYSRDGATTIDEDGKYLWSGTYEAKDPVADACGDYVAVGDRGDKQVHIFGVGGLMSDITVEHPILSVQVAKQGVTAVLMEEDNSVYMNLYKSNGELIAAIGKEISATGFPLSMALSDDGTKVVFSYLDISSGSLKTNIACYSFDEVGKNENDNFVGGNIIEGEVAAKIDFITNDILCIYKDSGFSLYKMERKLGEKPIVEEKFDTGIESIFSNGSYIGFVLDTAEEESKYKVVVYDTSGKKVLEKGINFDYSNVTIREKDIIFYNYSECYILGVRGNVRFQYKFDDGIDYMYGADANHYYVVHGSSIDVIKLKGAK